MSSQCTINSPIGPSAVTCDYPARRLLHDDVIDYLRSFPAVPSFFVRCQAVHQEHLLARLLPFCGTVHFLVHSWSLVVTWGSKPQFWKPSVPHSFKQLPKLSRQRSRVRVSSSPPFLSCT